MLQNKGENLLYIAATFKLFYHKMDIAAVVLLRCCIQRYMGLMLRDYERVIKGLGTS